MADNVAITAGSGTTIGTDDVGGVQIQRVKTTWGPDGTANDTDVATGKPLPAQIRTATGLIPLGEPTDAKNSATDTTSVAVIPLLKQVSAELQLLRTALGSTALDLGISTGGSRTLRVAVDTASQLASVADNADAVAASASLLNNPVVSKLMGWNGSTYDRLQVDANKYLKIAPQAGELHVGEVGGKTAVVAVTLSTDTSAYASGDLIADTQQIDAFFRKTDGTGVINSINIIDEDAQGVALHIIFMSTSTSLGTENSAPNISDANLTAGFQGIVSVATTDYVTVSGTKIATIKNIGLPVKAAAGTDDLYIAVLNATGTPTFTAAGLEMRIGALLD